MSITISHRIDLDALSLTSPAELSVPRTWRAGIAYARRARASR
jgi:hypothetical protein